MEAEIKLSTDEVAEAVTQWLRGTKGLQGANVNAVEFDIEENCANCSVTFSEQS